MIKLLFSVNTTRIPVTCLLAFAACFFSTASPTVRQVPWNIGEPPANQLPPVFDRSQGPRIVSALRNEAAGLAATHRLPVSLAAWKLYRDRLRRKILDKTGALVHQELSLDVRETRQAKKAGYTIKNISFQVRPGIYATANLYVPEGSGTFPGVLVMMGHSPNGRLYDKYQAVGITLALHGYVALCIDPWGAGERTTIHGVFEDHGDENNLGFALMNTGATLMGLLITDNIRGVDLLCSPPFVDRDRIGATGSSGGGNQAMWLTAMDERVRATVPVVSAGTFEAFVTGTPCICEVLPGALTFTGDAGILALIAPRALKMCNHSRDANAAFRPKEMVRSFTLAKPVFEISGADANIAYDTFDLAHGYFPEDRATMLGWFNLHLRGIGNGDAVAERPVDTHPAAALMVYPAGQPAPGVGTTVEYCKKEGAALRNRYLNIQSFDSNLKRTALKNMLGIRQKTTISKTDAYPPADGWHRFAITTSGGHIIPLLVFPPTSAAAPFTVLCDVAGKQAIAAAYIDRLTRSGAGVAIMDLSGTGEVSSPVLFSSDSTGRLRTLSKSNLLLGKTTMGEWVKELDVVVQYLKSTYRPSLISVDGRGEAGLAGLFLAALRGDIQAVALRESPPSYLFDNRSGIEYFSTAIHLPGFLRWGDVSLAAAISGSAVHFEAPVTMSGEPVSASTLAAYQEEFKQVRINAQKEGSTTFTSY